MQKFSKVWGAKCVMQDVLMKLTEASTKKKCLYSIRLDKF